ncbi:MAG TPA: DUF3703 domain-containing protein [Ramlibacter sp.]|nr:DUF3703 domain-containing protein [Ramlibacter sp.]
MDMQTDTHRIYAHLLQCFRASGQDNHEERWQWLAAAHIVGQFDFRLHLHSHAAMLGFALASGDWREASGQLLRLALVPIGHLTRRLPAGNTGRATVSAFRPMPLEAAMRQRIAAARHSVRVAGNHAR